MKRFRGYPVLVRRVMVRGETYKIIGPENYEALLDDPRVIARFEEDEYLPYWAEFWPAAVLLAEAILDWDPPEPNRPHHVLELGCGLGLVSLVAARAGYRVTASDYDEDALAFVRESARLNGLPTLETRFVDWRRTYPDLRPDRIVAAEVLYETRHLEPVAWFVRRHLAPGGLALLCDRNRTPADGFAAVAERCGLEVEVCAAEHVAPGGATVEGRLFRLWHRD